MVMKLVSSAIAALVGVGVATLAFTATSLQAQTQRWPTGRPMMGDGWQRGPGRGNMPCANGGLFDSDDVVTVQGTATQLDRYGRHQGQFLTVQTAQETLEVHLGPAWYWQDQGFEIALNSPIEVTGFRSDWRGQAVLMAAEITQGDRVLQLRDASGYPLWMGQGALSP